MILRLNQNARLHSRAPDHDLERGHLLIGCGRSNKPLRSGTAPRLPLTSPTELSRYPLSLWCSPRSKATWPQATPARREAREATTLRQPGAFGDMRAHTLDSQGRWPRHGGALTRDCCPRPLVSAFALPAAARQGAADCSGACKARPRVVLRRVQAPLGTAALSWRRCGSTGDASGASAARAPAARQGAATEPAAAPDPRGGRTEIEVE